MERVDESNEQLLFNLRACWKLIFIKQGPTQRTYVALCLKNYNCTGYTERQIQWYSYVKNSYCDPNLASEWFLRLLSSFSSGKTENRKFAEKPTTLNQHFQAITFFSNGQRYVSSSNSWILMNCFPWFCMLKWSICTNITYNTGCSIVIWQNACCTSLVKIFSIWLQPLPTQWFIGYQ